MRHRSPQLHRARAIGGSIAAAIALLSAGDAGAAPVLRAQVVQTGDFALIGNTIGHDCGPGTPAPMVGSVGNCGAGTADTAPDVFWQADFPANGQATADTSIAANRKSTAVLSLPPGAVVTHAYLYWASSAPGAAADPGARVDRPGTFFTLLNALTSYGATDAGTGIFYYQSVADVTSIVQQYGSGAYRVGGFAARALVGQTQDILFTAWWMVVLYQVPGSPLRTLTVNEGLDLIAPAAPSLANVTGLAVPSGASGRLGVIAFDGDNQNTGDQLFFSNALLSDAQNPANNFFNGTRSSLGAPVSIAGDLPRLTGGPQSMSGIDLDQVDVSALLSAGQSSATILASTTGDVFLLGGLVTSISAAKPDLSTSTKAALDINGGATFPGEVVEYTITVTNSGEDASAGTVLTDQLPLGVTYLPGSIQITQGANAGVKSDVTGDDQADYDPAAHTVTVRLGAGANAAQGGSLAPGASTTVVFYVTVDPGAAGTIANQGSIAASGLSGAPLAVWPTDGNGAAAGAPTTDLTIGCSVDAECGGPTSGVVCDTAVKDCIAGCRGTGNGCPAGEVCTSMDATIGSCVSAATSSSSASSSSSSSSSASSSSASSSSSSSAGGGTGGTGGMGGTGGVGGTSATSGTGGVGGTGGMTGSGGAGGTGGMTGSGGAGGAAGSGGSGVGGIGGMASASSTGGMAGAGGMTGSSATSGTGGHGAAGGTSTGGAVEGVLVQGGCLCEAGAGATPSRASRWPLFAAAFAILAARRRRRR